MKYSDGTEMKIGDWGWHMPHHINASTPYYMQFQDTVNGSPLDDAGLFQHEHMVLGPPAGITPMQHMYWSGSMSKTREEAIEQRAKYFEELAAKVRKLR